MYIYMGLYTCFFLNRLEDGRMYFFELYEKASDGAVVTDVKVWESSYPTVLGTYLISVYTLHSGGLLKEPTSLPYLLAPLPWQ